MSGAFLQELPIFLLLAIGSLAGRTFSDTLSLNDTSVFQVYLTDLHDTVPFMRRISIAASSKVTFNVTNVSSVASFMIFQIHTYQYNITLSFDKDYLNKVSNRSVFGSNVGLFSNQTKKVVTQLFLKNDNVHTVDALLVTMAYGSNVPIPGGCNMEFNTEVAPYLNVYMRDSMIIVDMQPASMPLKNNSLAICEKNVVEHQMYQMFLTEQDFSAESYFAAIESMLTVQSIKENGAQVASSTISSPMRRVFSAYTGVGSVYVAVATYGTQSAAYVPAFSYACSPILDPESCDILTYSSSKFICALCFFVGLLSLCLGHTCLVADMALPMFFTGTVFGYALSGGIWIGVLIGVCITIAWMLSRPCINCVADLMFTLSLGLFFASVAYFRSPDSFIVLQNDWVFWILFSTIALAISVLMVTLSTITYALTCAIFASFMIVLPLDYYFGSCLKYILINTVRRATIEGFNLAVVLPPVQTTDIILIILWTCLALYRFWKQLCSLGITNCVPTEAEPLLG